MKSVSSRLLITVSSIVLTASCSSLQEMEAEMNEERLELSDLERVLNHEDNEKVQRDVSAILKISEKKRFIDIIKKLGFEEIDSGNKEMELYSLVKKTKNIFVPERRYSILFFENGSYNVIVVYTGV